MIPLSSILLIVDPDEKAGLQFAEVAKGTVPGAQPCICREGYNAIMRLESVLPRVLVTSFTLHKSYSGHKLGSMSIIVTATPPGEAGRVRFLPGPRDFPSEMRAIRGEINDLKEREVLWKRR